MSKSTIRKIVIVVTVFLNILLFWKIGRAFAFFFPPPVWANRFYWFHFTWVGLQLCSPAFAVAAILWRGTKAATAGVSAPSIIRTTVVVIAMILGVFSFADSAYFLWGVVPNFSTGPYAFDLTTPALECIAPLFSAVAIFWRAQQRASAART
jgi:hypothetical protein